jgi:hypothetical protein
MDAGVSARSRLGMEEAVVENGRARVKIQSRDTQHLDSFRVTRSPPLFRHSP